MKWKKFWRKLAHAQANGVKVAPAKVAPAAAVQVSGFAFITKATRAHACLTRRFFVCLFCVLCLSFLI